MNNDNTKPNEYEYVLCTRPVKNSFSFITHWFIRSKYFDLDIHPAHSDIYSIFNKDGDREYDTRTVCAECSDAIISGSKVFKHIWGMFPIINCESICKELFYGTPISIQLCTYVVIFMVAFAALVRPDLMLVCMILIAVFIILLKYTTTPNFLLNVIRSDGKICKHLIKS
jgi:hypothetical protein